MSGGAVAAVSAPTGHSLIGKVAATLSARSRARSGRPSKAAAFLQDHTGTITALGFADTAAWHAGVTWGLVATAACVLVAEFKVRG
jgi:hypothetical protein